MILNTKRLVLSAVAAFVFFYVFDGAFHGIYMHDSYMATASLWRSPETMKSFAPWVLGGQAFIASMFALIFAYGCEGRGWLEGWRYGFFFTLFVIGGTMIWYAVLPIPMDMFGKWVVAEFLKFSAAGIIVSLIYSRA